MVVHVFTEQMTAQKFFSKVGFDPKSFSEKDFYRDRQAKSHSKTADQKTVPEEGTIVVIGTGNLAKALISRLTKRGFRVVVASRDPEKRRSEIESCGAEIEDYEDAFEQSDIVISAIPCEGFSSLPANLLKRKIVIDASNRPPNSWKNDASLACQLQEDLPDSHVVKAFNTLPAYGLQNDSFQGSREVPVCADDEDAKMTVMSFLRNLDLTPVDRGNLSNATEIEGITMEFFPEWKLAAILAFCIFLFASTIMLFRHQLCPNIMRYSLKSATTNGSIPWNWGLFDNILLENVQISFGLTAITLLSTCYLPGVIASYIQLFRGTKYSRFPNWLDHWLKSRKNIGLLTQYFASMHAIMSIFALMEDGFPDDWKGYSYLAIGCFVIGMLTILGNTSIPSVSESLTWREFSFMHRYLGWWALFLSVWHMIFNQWEQLISNKQSCIVIPGEGQIFIILPVFTIILKLILLLPCIDFYLDKIRRGQEINPRAPQVQKKTNPRSPLRKLPFIPASPEHNNTSPGTPSKNRPLTPSSPVHYDTFPEDSQKKIRPLTV